MTTLNGKKRDIKENLDSLRAGGFLPAVFYGAGKESTPISVDSKEFEAIYNEVGETGTFVLVVDGENVDVLIHEVGRHPVSNMPNHVDFLAIDTNKPVTVSVPLEFVGTSEAEREGGIISKSLHEIEIEALPKDLPEHLEVDLTLLATEDSIIHLKDLKLPAGVTLVNDPEKTVASVTVAKEESDEVVSAEDAMANIEVEKKGKAEEGAENPEA